MSWFHKTNQVNDENDEYVENVSSEPPESDTIYPKTLDLISEI